MIVYNVVDFQELLEMMLGRKPTSKETARFAIHLASCYIEGTLGTAMLADAGSGNNSRFSAELDTLVSDFQEVTCGS